MHKCWTLGAKNLRTKNRSHLLRMGYSSAHIFVLYVFMCKVRLDSATMTSCSTSNCTAYAGKKVSQTLLGRKQKTTWFSLNTKTRLDSTTKLLYVYLWSAERTFSPAVRALFLWSFYDRTISLSCHELSQSRCENHAVLEYPVSKSDQFYCSARRPDGERVSQTHLHCSNIFFTSGLKWSCASIQTLSQCRRAQEYANGDNIGTKLKMFLTVQRVKSNCT